LICPTPEGLGVRRCHLIIAVAFRLPLAGSSLVPRQLAARCDIRAAAHAAVEQLQLLQGRWAAVAASGGWRTSGWLCDGATVGCQHALERHAVEGCTLVVHRRDKAALSSKRGWRRCLLRPLWRRCLLRPLCQQGALERTRRRRLVLPLLWQRAGCPQR
jgi:hypothetical protein